MPTQRAVESAAITKYFKAADAAEQSAAAAAAGGGVEAGEGGKGDVEEELPSDVMEWLMAEDG
jgi:hypothetical protein